MDLISPSIPKTWNEIVELILRAACVVLCFIIMICAAVTLSRIESINNNVDAINEDFDFGYEYSDSSDFEAAAGWLVFVAVIGMVIEPAIIILRILNISFVNANFLIFGIVDIVISAVFVVSLLAGGAANAAYSSDNDDVYDDYEARCNDNRFTRIREFEDICNVLPTVSDSQAASAAFSFFGMVAFGALAGIMAFTILFRNRTSAGSAPSE